MQRGSVIVIEGPDCAGKTTLCKQLVQTLKNAEYIKLPDRGTPTGKLIDGFIKKEVQFSEDHESNERAAQMLFAANNMEKRATLIKKLNAGITLVFDRYVPSGIVYHSCSLGTDETAFITALNRGMPKPDVVFVLKLPFEVASQRRKDYGKERNDNKEMHDLVSAQFRTTCPTAHFVDATQTPTAVLEEVMDSIGLVLGFNDNKSATELSFY